MDHGRLYRARWQPGPSQKLCAGVLLEAQRRCPDMEDDAIKPYYPTLYPGTSGRSHRVYGGWQGLLYHQRRQTSDIVSLFVTVRTCGFHCTKSLRCSYLKMTLNTCLSPVVLLFISSKYTPGRMAGLR